MRRVGSVLAILGIGLAVGAPFVLGRGAVLGNLRNVAPQMFILLAGLSVISGIAKAGKLQLLQISLGQRLPFLRTVAISFATDFAFLSSPAGAAGYIVNVALLKSAGTTWTVATAVVGAEQALDLVFFAVVIPVAAIFAAVPLVRILPTASGFIYLTFFAAAALMAFALWRGRHLIVKTLHGFAQTVPWFKTRQNRIGEFVLELRRQMVILIRGSASRNIALLLLTILQWLARYGVLWIVLLKLGHKMPFGFVLALQAVILHLAMWTGIPAGGGSADLALAAALAPWVPSPTIAVVLLLWRFSTLYFPLLVGALSLAAMTFHTWRVSTMASINRS